METWRPVNGDDNIVQCVALLPDATVLRQQFATCAIGECKDIVDKANVAWTNIAVVDIGKDAGDVAASLGFTKDLVEALMKASQSEYEDRDTELGMRLPVVKVEGMDIRTYPLLILVRKGLILTMHPMQVKRFVRFSRYAEGFMRKFKESATVVDRMTLLLIRIVDENNEKNFDGLRELQEVGEKLSQFLVDTKGATDDLGLRIHQIKQSLVDYLGALWASQEVLHSLRFGDADVITDNPKILQKIEMLNEEISRNISLGEHVSEVMASGLGVLQTIYNNQLQIYNNQLQLLNNKLALLASWMAVVATAVAVPNTLATIFGVAPIAELLPWEVIVFVLIMSTIISTYFTYVYIKAKGWFPEKYDETEDEKR